MTKSLLFDASFKTFSSYDLFSWLSRIESGVIISTISKCAQRYRAAMSRKFIKQNAFRRRAHGPLIDLVSGRIDLTDSLSFRSAVV